jgi:uncharacterized membrane protein YkoI
MNDKLKGVLIAAAAVAALAGGGAAIAGATGNDASDPSASQGSGVQAGDDKGAKDDEAGRDDGNGQPVTGSPLDRASAVALQQTGGGSVTGSEIDDEEGYYEIEVTKADGSQVDVHLDRDFNLIDASSDGGGED